MKRFFKLTSLLCVAAAMYVPPASAQNYNFNFGGLQYSSGPTVPGSCSRDGMQFFKNSTTKGWYTCIDGAYVANGGGSGAFLPLSLGGDTTVNPNGHLLDVAGPFAAGILTIDSSTGVVTHDVCGGCALPAGSYVVKLALADSVPRYSNIVQSSFTANGTDWYEIDYVSPSSILKNVLVGEGWVSFNGGPFQHIADANAYTTGVYLDSNQAYDSVPVPSTVSTLPILETGPNLVINLDVIASDDSATIHVHTSANDASGAHGIESDSTNRGGGSIYGFRVYNNADGIAATGDIYGLGIPSPGVSNGAVPAHSYGISIDSVAVSPISYGIQIGDQSGTGQDFGIWINDFATAGSTDYYTWFDSRGVQRCKEDTVFNGTGQAICAVYNNQFAKYTPGAANYERLVFGEWDGSNVAHIGTEAGGTGTLRDLQLMGGHILLPVHSTTGTRYLCVSTNGTISASASACSGT